MRIVLLCLLFLPIFIPAQEKDSNDVRPVLQYGIGAHYGFVLIHSEEVRTVKNSYPLGLQFDLAWQYRAKKSFNQCNCFPKIGVFLQLWDYDNPDILGYGAHALFYIEPEYGAGSRLSFAFRAAYGLSYSTNPYDEIENPDNQSYSTPVNFALYLGLKTSLKVSPQSKIALMANYNHISNGGIKQPNKGINFPTASLHYEHYIGDPNFPKYNKAKWDHVIQRRIDISTFLSWQQVEQGTHLISPGVEVKLSRQIAKISALTVGMEFLNDNFNRHEYEKTNQDKDWRKFSLLAGHEFLLGRLKFSQQIGYYLYNENEENDPIYQRYGLSYNIFEHLALGVNIKAHRNVADLVDYRLIFSL